MLASRSAGRGGGCGRAVGAAGVSSGTNPPPWRDDIARYFSAIGTLARSAAASTHSMSAAPDVFLRCAFMSPSRYALRMRNSNGFMPTRRASLSICTSMAKSEAVTPKPRMAVDGVRLV